MVRKRRMAPAVLAGVLSVGGVAGIIRADVAQAEPTREELQQQLRDLQSRVERMEAAERESRLETARDVDALIGDADRRSTLLGGGGFTAGYNNGKFLIQDESGDFVLNPSFQLQIRGVWNYREEDADDQFAGDATNESGLEIRRMKFAIDGNVFGPNTKYKFQWATNRNNGDLTLEEAFVVHKFADQWSIKAGQFKDVTFREEFISSKRQLAVDRSLLNEVLAGGQTDFIQGVGLLWDDGDGGLPIRAEFGYSDGPNSDNTNFVDGGGNGMFGTAAPDYGIYGRVDWLAMGPARYADDFTAMDNEDSLLVIGGGFHFAEAGDATSIHHTVDAQFETNFGLGVYGALVGVYSDPSGPAFDDDDDEDGGGDSLYDYGFLVQAGYMVTEKCEVFARYDYTAIDDERFNVGDTDDGGVEDEFSEITVGTNYYMHKHASKFTIDASWLPDGTPSEQNGISILDPDADTDQFTVRAQYQLLI